MPVKSLAHFCLLGSLVFIILFRNSLYILDMSPLYGMYVANVSYRSVTGLLTPLVTSCDELEGPIQTALSFL